MQIKQRRREIQSAHKSSSKHKGGQSLFAKSQTNFQKLQVEKKSKLDMLKYTSREQDHGKNNLIVKNVPINYHSSSQEREGRFKGATEITKSIEQLGFVSAPDTKKRRASLVQANKTEMNEMLGE